MGGSARKVRFNRVIDGDTIEVSTSHGLFRSATRARIRLYGIDAPESTQKRGRDSARYLESLIGSKKKVWLDTKSTDQYGRSVGLVYHRKRRPDQSCNYLMVLAGHARAYMATGQEKDLYRLAETEASRKRRGIWRDRHATDPWEHRRIQREKPQGTPFAKILLLLLASGALAAAAIYIIAQRL